MAMGFANTTASIIKLATSIWQLGSEPEVTVLADEDIPHEPSVQKLDAEGREAVWCGLDKLRGKTTREGWQPVRNRNALGKDEIFINRSREAILMSRPKARR